MPRKRKPRKSVIWTTDRDTLAEIVSRSKSFGDVLRELGTEYIGRNRTRMRERVQADGIDFSHFEKRSRIPSKGSTAYTHDEIFTINPDVCIRTVKMRAIKDGLIENACRNCGLTDSWMGEPLVLQLDHINGNPDDNRVENLRLLCPNCHSQTPTFCGRKLSWSAECDGCGNKILTHSKTGYCQNCLIDSYKSNKKLCIECKSHLNPNNKGDKCYQCKYGKSHRGYVAESPKPDYETLIKLIAQHGLTGVGKIYDRSASCVGHWRLAYEREMGIEIDRKPKPREKPNDRCE